MNKDFEELDQIHQLYPNSNFLQSSLWAKTNQLLNNTTVVKVFNNQAAFLAIVRTAKRGRYLEIPAGPLVNWESKVQVKTVFTEIINLGKNHHCVFVRFRPQLEDTPENQKFLNQALKPFSPRPAPMHLAAQNTVILNLNKSEEELLMSLRRQTRYEVRRAEKQGIKIKELTTESALQDFHKVQLATAKRQDFIPPSLEELQAEKAAFGNNFHLFSAELPETESPETELPETDPSQKPAHHNLLCYGLFLSDGREAAYYEAASTELARKHPGAYALIWHAIKFFKNQGVERLNLWGIAPPGVEHHRYSGVTTFKTGFGGKVKNYIPAQDLVLDPLRYKFTNLIETARKKKRHL